MKIILRRPDNSSLEFIKDEPGRDMARRVEESFQGPSADIVEYVIESNPLDFMDALNMALLFLDEFSESLSRESIRRATPGADWSLEFVLSESEMDRGFLTEDFLDEEMFRDDVHEQGRFTVQERSCVRLLARLRRALLLRQADAGHDFHDRGKIN